MGPTSCTMPVSSACDEGCDWKEAVDTCKDLNGTIAAVLDDNEMLNVKLMHCLSSYHLCVMSGYDESFDKGFWNILVDRTAESITIQSIYLDIN